MQDYKSLCAAVTICFTLVNIHTHTRTQKIFDQLIWLAQPAKTTRLQSWNSTLGQYCAYFFDSKRKSCSLVSPINLKMTARLECKFSGTNQICPLSMALGAYPLGPMHCRRGARNSFMSLMRQSFQQRRLTSIAVRIYCWSMCYQQTLIVWSFVMSCMRPADFQRA